MSVRVSLFCALFVSTGDPVSQLSQSLCSLVHRLSCFQPGLVRSFARLARSLARLLAHSSFQFASESKGLIKSPQTGFSGISRVNAKESQADQRRCMHPVYTSSRLFPSISSLRFLPPINRFLCSSCFPRETRLIFLYVSLTFLLRYIMYRDNLLSLLKNVIFFFHC